MRRRVFLAGVGTVALSRAPFGQHSKAVIGLLGSSAAHDYQPMIAAFSKGLSESGYLEGKNVRFDNAWANDQYDRLPTLASELVERRVSLILAASTPSAIAAKSATTPIPIVFAIGGDPVTTGLISSLNRPGGNLTGAAHINVDTAAKVATSLPPITEQASTQDVFSTEKSQRIFRFSYPQKLNFR